MQLTLSSAIFRLSFLMTALWTPVLAAQSIAVGGIYEANFYPRLQLMGDLNGDGCDDFFDDDEFHSGKDGSFLAPAPPFSLGLAGSIRLAPLGDLDNDGIDEWLQTTLLSNPWIDIHSISSSVCSGTNLTPLFEIENVPLPDHSTPQFLLARVLGDVNGDDILDIGYSWFQSGSDTLAQQYHFQVASGFDGSLLLDLSSQYTFTASFSSLEDFTGDGKDDYLIQTPFSPVFLNGGTMAMYSGATHQPVRIWHGVNANEGLGAHMQSVRDLDGDGHRDVIAWCPGYEVNGIPVGRVVAFSSDTTNVIWQRNGPFSDNIMVRNAGDMDGDGYADVGLFGFSPSSAMGSKFVSGFDGTLVDIDFPTSLTPTQAPNSVRPGMDFNGDGIPEVVHVFAPPIPSAPIVELAFSQRYGTKSFGFSTPGSNFQLSWDQFASDPSSGYLRATGAMPNSSLLLGLSLSTGAGAPLTGGHPLWISPLIQDEFSLFSISANATGTAAIPLSLRIPSFSGTSVYLQAARTTLPDALSNGMELLFTN